jgi:hypothetical protein
MEMAKLIKVLSIREKLPKEGGVKFKSCRRGVPNNKNWTLGLKTSGFEQVLFRNKKKGGTTLQQDTFGTT